MEPRKELRYPILQTLLQYLEANQRIELVHRCPILKFVDLATPISLDYLFLGTSSIRINQSRYQLGVIREFPKDHSKFPKKFRKDNESGGVGFDLDEFGRKDSSGNQIVCSGNVAIETSYHPIPVRNNEEEDILMEQYKRRLAHLKTLRRMKERKNEMEYIEAALYSWTHRREGTHPPYTKYLRYTHTSNDKKVKIENLEYNQKLYEAMENIYNKFFHGRKYPVKVHSLKVTHVGGVLRIPESLKIRALKLFTGTNVTSVMNSIRNLLVGSGNLFGTYAGYHLAENYTHPEIITAKRLILIDVKLTGPMFHILLELENSRVEIQNGNLTIEEYNRLIDHFVERKREIGTNYSFNVHNKKLIKQLFNEIKERDAVVFGKQTKRGCPRFPYVYTLPLDSSKISIFCEKNIHFDGKDKYIEPWVLWILIEAKSTPAVVNT